MQQVCREGKVCYPYLACLMFDILEQSASANINRGLMFMLHFAVEDCDCVSMFVVQMQTDGSDAQEDDLLMTVQEPEMSESSTDSSTVVRQSILVPRKHSSGSKVNQAAKRPKHMQRSPTNASANGPTDDMDADEIFGRHVANELKLIRGMREKQFAKLQINNILFNAQFGLVKLPEHILQSLAELDDQQQLPE